MKLDLNSLAHGLRSNTNPGAENFSVVECTSEKRRFCIREIVLRKCIDTIAGGCGNPVVKYRVPFLRLQQSVRLLKGS